MNLTEATEIYFQHLRANGRDAAPKSYKSYYKVFFEHIGKQHIEDITESDWYTFVEYLKSRYKTNSRAYCINALRPFFRYWNRRGLSKILPDTIVSQRYIEVSKDTLDEDEYEALLEVIGQDTVIGSRDTLIIRMLSETGMRVGELTALTIADLGTGQDCIAQIRTKKNQELGHVMWSKETNHILHKYLGFRLCYPGESVFISVSHSSFGKRLTSRSIERIVRTYTSQVTPKKITPHCLRHTKAHQLLKKGATAEEFNLVLRHKGWQSRFKYLRLSRPEFMAMASKYIR